MSKLLLNNLVRYYAHLPSTKANNLLINGICPGFCATGGTTFKSIQPTKLSDLNSMIPIDKPKTSEDGAEMVLSMALIPETFKRPNGTFLLDI